MLNEKDPTLKELAEAEKYWIKRCQLPMQEELLKSTVEGKLSRKAHIALENSGVESSKITGQYRNLAPKLDEDGIWRVGTRMSLHVPFTADG